MRSDGGPRAGRGGRHHQPRHSRHTARVGGGGGPAGRRLHHQQLQLGGAGVQGKENSLWWRCVAPATSTDAREAKARTRLLLLNPYPHFAPVVTPQVALSLALGESMAHRLRCRLFDALLHRDPLFFDSVKTGQMVAWLGQDIEVLQVRMPNGVDFNAACSVLWLAAHAKEHNLFAMVSPGCPAFVSH